MTLTSPLLSGLVGNICDLQSPGIPEKPVPFKADEDLWGHGRSPAKPGTPSPSLDGGVVPKIGTDEGEALETRPPDQEESSGNEPLPNPDLKEVDGIVITDDEDMDATIMMPQAASSPRSDAVLSLKQSSEEGSPRSSSPKKRATEEEERSTPPLEALLPRGVTKEDILPKRYETFVADNDWVQRMRCSLLGLEAGTKPSRKDIDNAEHYIP